jgi:predicted N-acyltransferase
MDTSPAALLVRQPIVDLRADLIGYRLSCQAGAQGEHKLARGYEPVETFSAHEFADVRLSSAVEDFLRRERAHVEAEIEVYGEHVPFKKGENL